MFKVHILDAPIYQRAGSSRNSVYGAEIPQLAPILRVCQIRYRHAGLLASRHHCGILRSTQEIMRAVVQRVLSASVTGLSLYLNIISAFVEKSVCFSGR